MRGSARGAPFARATRLEIEAKTRSWVTLAVDSSWRYCFTSSSAAAMRAVFGAEKDTATGGGGGMGGGKWVKGRRSAT